MFVFFLFTTALLDTFFLFLFFFAQDLIVFIISIVFFSALLIAYWSLHYLFLYYIVL